ncbi:MAG: glycosyltransferase family 4 protein [Candidatus Pacearchaeota archaeon]
MKKIIYIHARSYPYNQTFYKEGSDDYFFFGEGPLYILNKPVYEKSFEFEVWRSEVGLKKLKEKFVYQVKCRIFPGFHIKRLDTISLSLVKSLFDEIRKNEIIIHYTASPHKFEFYLILFLLGKRAKIFVSHQGGANPFWKFCRYKRISSYIAYLIEKWLFKRAEWFFAVSETEINYLKDIIKIDRIYTNPHWGLDIQLYEPIEKDFSREYLKLDKNKKYILLFGKLNKYRGVSSAIQVRDKLREKYDVELLSVGSDETCPDYQIAKESGVILRGYVPIEDMKYYYSAGDVYLYLTNGEENELFAGTGIAPLEALACNIPVVSNVFYHFKHLNLQNYGVYVKTIDEAVNAIDKIWSGKLKLENGRTLIEKYFDWRVITKEIFELYHKTFSENL